MVGPGGVGTSSEQALRHFMSHTHIRALSGVGGGGQRTPETCACKATAALSWGFKAQVGLEKEGGVGTT